MARLKRSLERGRVLRSPEVRELLPGETSPYDGQIESRSGSNRVQAWMQSSVGCNMQLPAHRIEDWLQRLSLLSLNIALQQTNVSPGDFLQLDAFRHLIEEGCRLVCVSHASTLDGTYSLPVSQTIGLPQARTSRDGHRDWSRIG
jgi:hypothetical protein